MSEDKLTILISIARQLKHCNSSQLATSFEQIIQILKEDKPILQSIILNGICKAYSNIKTATLKQIHSILPNEKALKINDSITKSQIIIPPKQSNVNTIATIENKTEPLTFLQIPCDLKYYLFQYLYENDLYSLEKTCRSVCIDARNANSLYYIHIKNMLNINNYTQNKRYNKVKYLDLDVLWKHFNNYRDCHFDHKILPSINLFSEIHTIHIGGVTFLFVYSKDRFDDLLNVFYNILINGNSNKTLIFDIDGWDISFPIQLDWIFDTNYNKLARQILPNIKTLFINSTVYSQAISIISNVFSARMTNTNYELDLVELDINHISQMEIDESWNWNMILNIRKYSKIFNVRHVMEFYETITYDSTFWDDFADGLTKSNCKQLPDKVFLRFVFYDQEIQKILNFEEHMNRWLQFDSDLLNKLGMKSIYIECEYLMIHDDSVIKLYCNNNKDEILNHVEKWNKIHKLLQSLLEKFCEKNPLIKYGFGENDIDIQFDQELVCSYRISYQINHH